MMRFRGLAVMALMVLLWGCGDDDGNGPGDRQFEGTWTGTFTNSLTPTQEFQATLDLIQTEDEVTGTLTTTSGREASVSGTVSGDQLEATFTFTDDCSGSATSTADLIDETVPPSLEGSYIAEDCLGETDGEFSLLKEE